MLTIYNTKSETSPFYTICNNYAKISLSLQPQNLKTTHWTNLGGFLLKIITFQASPNIKLKVRSHSLRMQLFGFDFFFCSTKAVRVIKSGQDCSCSDFIIRSEPVAIFFF